MSINKDKKDKRLEDIPKIVEWVCHNCGCCFLHEVWEMNGGVCPCCGAGGFNLEPLYG